MTDYEFFEQSLVEQRTYRLHADSSIKMARHPAMDDFVKILSDDEEDFQIRGSHALDAGSPIGLAYVNERLNVTLPRDIDDFYRRWSCGVLVFREFYYIYSPQEMVEETLRWRALHGHERPLEPTVRVVRFCRFYDGCEFVLRQNDQGIWEVFATKPGSLEQEILSDVDGWFGGVSDASFRDWLKRLCETDGCPPAPDWAEEEWWSDRLDGPSPTPPRVPEPPEPPEPPPDRSTPKAALRSFILAIQRFDHEESNSAVAVTDEAYQEYADLLLKQWWAQSSLRSVAWLAFAEDEEQTAKFLLQHSIHSPLLRSLMLSGLDAAEERVEGRWAVLTFADARLPRVLMSFVDGEWLVVVHPPGQLSELPEQVRLLRPLVKALSEFRMPDNRQHELQYLTEYLRSLRQRLEKAVPLIRDSFGGSIADSRVPR